ncbi:YceK/YidQ family lipoprotein [bacterium]|nr:YceK/YidQ family lipoprotein [bacterium]
MRTRARKIVGLGLAAALLAPLSGCASTLAQVDGHHAPYTGTAVDAAIAVGPFTSEGQHIIAKAPPVLLLWPVALADLPLSLALDTVTLPVQLARSSR